MRLITPGKPKTPTPELQSVCPECRCIFAFTEDDIRKEQLTVGAAGRAVTIKCPQQGCGHELKIKLA